MVRVRAVAVRRVAEVNLLDQAAQQEYPGLLAEQRDQLPQLLPRDQMTGPQIAKIALVEQGEPGGEEFAVDHALGQARGYAKANPLAQFGQGTLDADHVARLGMAGAVAHHDPVHLRPLLLDCRLAAREPGFPDQLGIEAEAANLEAFRVDLPDKVEIDETVVQRRYQRVRLAGDMARQRIVATRRVEDDEIGLLRKLPRQRFYEKLAEYNQAVWPSFEKGTWASIRRRPGFFWKARQGARQGARGKIGAAVGRVVGRGIPNPNLKLRSGGGGSAWSWCRWSLS